VLVPNRVMLTLQAVVLVAGEVERLAEGRDDLPADHAYPCAGAVGVGGEMLKCRRHPNFQASPRTAAQVGHGVTEPHAAGQAKCHFAAAGRRCRGPAC
jgi:hypothetical protein